MDLVYRSIAVSTAKLEGIEARYDPVAEHSEHLQIISKVM